MRYTNPIIPGFHPDPSVCRVGDDYYLVNSSFEYVPGVPISQSRDLVHWRQIGSCLTRPSQLPLPLNVPSLGIYAPTIRYHNGTFYMITTNVDLMYGSGGQKGNFYVSTDDPAGEWSEPIWVDQTGIDPSLFFDDDGRVYLTSSYDPGTAFTDPNTTNPGWGIQQSEIGAERDDGWPRAEDWSLTARPGFLRLLGRPRVGDNGRIALSTEGPNVPEVTWPAPASRDNFDGPTLGLDWNFLRWPRAEDWSLTARPGFLRLLGNASRLEDGSGVAFVGRRQEHATCETAALLDFTPQADEQEAGLTVWMNQSHHYDIAVTRLRGERRVIVRRRIGTLSAIVASEPLLDGPVTLQVRAAERVGAFSFAGTPTYTFSYALGEGEPRELASGEARYLATEVAGGFTGVYFALYATANGEQTAAPADFDWFVSVPIQR
jgi:beta-xylosidase